MRKVRWQWKIILFLMFAGLFCPVKVHAEEADSYLDGLSDEMDYGKLDAFLENYGVIHYPLGNCNYYHNKYNKSPKSL